MNYVANENGYFLLWGVWGRGDGRRGKREGEERDRKERGTMKDRERGERRDGEVRQAEVSEERERDIKLLHTNSK